MKAFRFNRHKKVIKGYEDEVFSEKKLNWDRVIYYMVLILVIGSLSLFVLKKSCFVSAFGEVITNKFEVKFSDDVKITRYYVNEEQEVNVGDTLLVVRPELSPADSIGYKKISGSNSNSNWLEHEFIMTKKSINLKIIEIKNLIAAEKYENSKLNRVKEEVYLGLETADEISTIESKLFSIVGQKRSLREEVSLFKDYLKKLKGIENDKVNSFVNVKLLNENIAYISPVRGVVNQIYAKESEVTYKQEVAMDVFSLEDVFVSAFIPQKYLIHFNVNDTIGVKFNKHVNSLGIIKSIYFNTVELPIEFRSKYQKNSRNIIARIEPLNDSMRKEWKPFFKMAVVLYEPRIFKSLWIDMRMRKINDKEEITGIGPFGKVKGVWKTLLAKLNIGRQNLMIKEVTEVQSE
jgi:hypothetical protein